MNSKLYKQKANQRLDGVKSDEPVNHPSREPGQPEGNRWLVVRAARKEEKCKQNNMQINKNNSDNKWGIGIPGPSSNQTNQVAPRMVS